MPIEFSRSSHLTARESVCHLDGLPKTAKRPPVVPKKNTGTCYDFSSKAVMAQIDRFRVHPFDLDNLKTSELELNMPLLAGNHLLPTLPNREAQLHIPAETQALVRGHMPTKVGGARESPLTIELSKPIVIRNPSRAFKACKTNFQKLKAWALDLVATVEIHGLRVDPSSGQVIPIGLIRCWGPIPNRNLSSAIPQDVLPTMMLSAAEVRSEKSLFRTEKSVKKDKPIFPGFLAKVKTLLKPACFLLKASVFPKRPDILNSLSLPTPENVNLCFRGMATLQPHGIRLQTIKSEAPTLKSRFMEGDIDADVYFERSPEGQWQQHGTFGCILKTNVPSKSRTWALQHHLKASGRFEKNGSEFKLERGILSLEGNLKNSDSVRLEGKNRNLTINGKPYPLPCPDFINGSKSELESPQLDFNLESSFKIQNGKFTSNDGKFDAKLVARSLTHEGGGISVKMPAGTSIHTGSDDLAVELDRSHICVSTGARISIQG